MTNIQSFTIRIILSEGFPWVLFFRLRKFLSISNLLRIFIIPGNGPKRRKTEKREVEIVELKPVSLWLQLL